MTRVTRRRSNLLIAVFLFSFAALIVAHAIFLQKAPGFQMDEGLFADTANRIAGGERIPLLEGMVSYTTWICSYLPALLFKLFGPSVITYRLSGVIYVSLGVLLISASLLVLGERRAAAILPGIIAFFPALVINQRWVVEATTFFALCAGLASLGLALKTRQGRTPAGSLALALGSSALIVMGVSAGIYSHIVFIAPVLALYFCLLAAGKITRLQDRLTVLAICLIGLPFFAKISQLEPKAKLQSTALMAADLAVILLTLAPALVRAIPIRYRQRMLALASAPGVLLLVPFLIFIEGHWLAMFSVGFLDFPWLIGLPVLVACLAFFKNDWRIRSVPLACFLPLSVFFVYGMVIKAGPRYFEVMFLFVAVALSIAAARLRPKRAALFGALWVLQGSLILGLNYFAPSVQERQIHTTFHVWRWWDSSSGFLPKMRLIRRLAAEGCGYSNVDFTIRDDNTHGAFRLLKLSDWPPYVPPCRLGAKVRISSRLGADLQAPEQPQRGIYAEGPFWITTVSR